MRAQSSARRSTKTNTHTHTKESQRRQSVIANTYFHTNSSELRRRRNQPRRDDESPLALMCVRTCACVCVHVITDLCVCACLRSRHQFCALNRRHVRQHVQGTRSRLSASSRQHQDDADNDALALTGEMEGAGVVLFHDTIRTSRNGATTNEHGAQFSVLCVCVCVGLRRRRRLVVSSLHFSQSLSFWRMPLTAQPCGEKSDVRRANAEFERTRMVDK